MSISPKNNETNKMNRAEELFQAWLDDGRLSEVEAAELQDIWRQHPNVFQSQRKEFHVEQYLRFFSELRENDSSAARTLLENEAFPKKPQGRSVRFSEDCDFDENVWQELFADSRSRNNADHLDRLAASRSQKTYGALVFRYLRQIPFQSALLAFSLFLLGIFSFGLYWEYTKSPRPFAFHAGPSETILGRVLHAPEAVWPKAGERFKAGRKLHVGDKIVLEDGCVEIMLHNNIRMALEGKGELRLDAVDRAICTSGRLSVEFPVKSAAKSGRIDIDTPQYSVRKKAGSFVLDMTERKNSLHVLEGEAQIRPLFGDWETIAPNRGLEITATKEIRRIDADSNLFLDENHVKAKVALAQDRRTRQNASWNGNPSLLLRLDFDSMQASVLNNAAEHSDLRVSRSGGTMETGSVKNKKSLRFQKTEDRLETFLPDQYEVLTLFARIRIDRFDHVNQTLLVSRNLYSDGGGILWQINSFGDLQFHIRSSDGNETRRYDAKNVFPKRETETWLNLAVVFDAKNRTVIHYLEGEPVSTLPMDSSFSAIQPGLVSLGNGFSGTGSDYQRFLSGSMEEFMIFGRALSESEIRDLCYDL